jgi:drug/metabolite transporter (DMT)-like permease
VSLTRARALTVAAVIVTVTLWSSAFVGIRSADRSLSPGALAFGRLLVGSVVLGAFVLLRDEKLPGRAGLRGVVVCGVLWFGIYNIALNEAEKRVDAGIAAMLVNIGPILIAILAGLILREGFLRGCSLAAWWRSPGRR